MGIVAAGLCGCESFVKKFRREKPQDESKKEEVIVAPQEYAASFMSSQEQYQQYFILWRAWQDELLDSFSEGTSRKRQLDALKQGMRNLDGMRGLLIEDKARALAARIDSLKKLEQAVMRDGDGFKADQYRQDADRLRSQIIREFAPAKVQGKLR